MFGLLGHGKSPAGTRTRGGESVRNVSNVKVEEADVTQAADAEEAPVAVESRPGSKEQERKEPRKVPRFHVVLWNDDDHTYEYVIRMLTALFGHPKETSLRMAKEVDTRGRCIVLTTTREHAELKRDQIHAFGRDPLVRGCAGSMTATVEPAE